MPITFDCECGKQLRVGDEFAGKRAKCPACGEVATVPAAAPPDEDDDRPRKSGTARRVAERDDEDDDRPRKKKRLTDDGTASGRDSDYKPKAKSMEGGIMNSGVLGGLAAMVGAVVWFVVGIAALNTYFIYPPILFIVGMVAVIKGLMASGEEE